MKTNFLGFRVYKTQSQAYATFEYQGIQFDFFCDLNPENHSNSPWQILEDQNVDNLMKILDIQRLMDSCSFQLHKINSYLFEGK